MLNIPVEKLACKQFKFWEKNQNCNILFFSAGCK
jgi:hypothetical protein